MSLSSSSQIPYNGTQREEDDDDRNYRFCMDYSLFRVAKSLRLLGYDAVCDPSLKAEQIVALSKRERRIVITGSKRLVPVLERMQRQFEKPQRRQPKLVGYDSDGNSDYETDDAEGSEEPLRYVIIRSTECHQEVLLDIIRSVSLPWNESKFFTRCVLCNSLIQAAEKEKIRPRVDPSVYILYAHFYQCPGCLKVFWGIDDGVIINYKSQRTIDYLRGFYNAFRRHSNNNDSGDSNAEENDNETERRQLRSHFSALPRAAKEKIFHFLGPAGVRIVKYSVPQVSLLAEAYLNSAAAKELLVSSSKRPATAPQPPSDD